MLKFRRSYGTVELYCNIVRTVCTTGIRLFPQTYYEILNLREDCTNKDVREAFIKLSKQIHPDKNPNNPKTHQRFVKLNEAYRVLSRPQERSAYDMKLRNRQQTLRTQSSHNAGVYNTAYANPYEKYNFWKPESSHNAEEKEGQRLSKSWIVFLCLLFASAGVGLQVLAIRKSLTFSREKLDKMTEENSRILSDIRRQANENDFDKQLEIMKQRLEDSVHQYSQRRRTND